MTTDVCCYHYDPQLEACTQFMYDRRLRNTCWTRSERKHYRRMEDEFREKMFSGQIKRPPHYQWYEEIFDTLRAQEADKTLIELPYNGLTSFILDERLKRGYFEKRGDRVLVVSFFHSDEDTKTLMYGGDPQDLLESKFSWIAAILQAKPFIKAVEIPMDFMLTKDYMRGLFEQYVLS
jgi:uncharacterized protein YkuJ